MFVAILLVRTRGEGPVYAGVPFTLTTQYYIHVEGEVISHILTRGFPDTDKF